MAFSEYLYPLEEEIDRVQAEILEIQEQIRLERQRREIAENKVAAAEAEVQDAKAAKLAAENKALAAEAEVQDAKAAKLAAERVTELMRLLLRDGRIDEATNLDTSTPAYQKLLQEYGLI